ncbi:MAG: hypothetical protein VX152_11945 [Pseudomonadota bacterium]|nr:hypothetical protein [Pseudomonadota bacterium]
MSLTDAQRDAFAKALFDADRSQSQIPLISQQHPGLDMEDAYAIQAALVRRFVEEDPNGEPPPFQKFADVPCFVAELEQRPAAPPARPVAPGRSRGTRRRCRCSLGALGTTRQRTHLLGCAWRARV